MDKTFWDRVKTRSKPTVAWMPRLKKWMCVSYHIGTNSFITGQAAKPATAFSAYKRKLKWHSQGRPGAGYRRY